MGYRSHATKHQVVHIHFIIDKLTYPGWKDIRNLVNVHSFYWIHEGEGTFLTNTEHKVKAGMLAYLRPGLEMSMRSEAQAPLRMTMVLFDCAELTYDAVWKDITPVGKLSFPFLSQYDSTQAEELGILLPTTRSRKLPSSAGIARNIISARCSSSITACLQAAIGKGRGL